MGLFGHDGVWRGYIGSPLTPFDENLQLDRDTFVKEINFLLESGVHAFNIQMHIGESLNLTVDERKELSEIAIDTVAGRVPVTVHASLPGTDQVIDLARHAAKVGAEGVVVITPYHWKPREEALFRHFVAVGESIDIALITYSYPEAMGYGISPQFFARLINAIPNYLGAKDAAYDMQTFTEYCRIASEMRPEFSVFTGIEYLLPGMILGGAGSFSGTGAVAPRLLRSLYDAVIEKDYEAARPLQYRVSRLWFTLMPDYPATIKAAMEIMGRPVGSTRLPVLPLNDEKKRWLVDALGDCGVLDTEPYGWNAQDSPDPERARAVVG